MPRNFLDSFMIENAIVTIPHHVIKTLWVILALCAHSQKVTDVTGENMEQRILEKHIAQNSE